MRPAKSSGGESSAWRGRKKHPAAEIKRTSQPKRGNAARHLPQKGLRAAPQASQAGHPAFLAVSAEDLLARGLEAPDVLLLSGDAYVDHPSFGTALLGRWLEAHGFSVLIAAQPAWEGPEAAQKLAALPRPRLFAGVSAGALDSMLAHYTAFRKKRRDDAYTPGGQAGARPNRACIVYTDLLRRAFPGLPVALGGIEASLRRASHYDFWTDSLRKSILLDSKADLLIYGMGERAILAVAQAAQNLFLEFQANPPAAKDAFRKALAARCRLLPGLATLISKDDLSALESTGQRITRLPSHADIAASPALLVKATRELELQVQKASGFAAQEADGRFVLISPPPTSLTEQEMDGLYALPFTRLPHPMYRAPIPAWEMIRTSITTHRGCGGGCSFCSLALHQGRRIASRGRESILAEAGRIAAGPDTGKAAPKWAGAISDIGGPSANMWRARCKLEPDKCVRSSCMFPKICPGFEVNQKEAVALLRATAKLPGVRHVRVASGVRFDLALRDEEALAAYTMEFTGGQLKVAPEHTCDAVLTLMRKPGLDAFTRFLDSFAYLSRKAGKEQYVIPYLISAFPGCTDEHMRELAAWLKKRNWKPQQAQCFVPTPGTMATAMYFSGKNEQGRDIYVARTDAERLRQHYLLMG